MGDLKPIIDVEMENAIRELKKLWETSEIDETCVQIDIGKAIPDSRNFEISINFSGIWCSLNYCSNKYIWLDSSDLLKEARKRVSDSISFVLPNVHFKTVFLKYFPVIKAEIEKKIKGAKEIKAHGMALIDDVLNELSVPVEEEQLSSGIQINVIDFGYRTVEIINNGSLVLDDKRPKQKAREEFVIREREKIELLKPKKMAAGLFNNNKKYIKKLYKVNNFNEWSDA